MAKIIPETSRTFSEYLLMPNLTTHQCIPENVDLTTPICRYGEGISREPLRLQIPLVSAVMQAVSDDVMAVALARQGGLSFIYGSQSLENQVAMVKRVKNFKAGFVSSDSNLTPNSTVADLVRIKEQTRHSTVAVTDDGTAHGKLLGIVTSKDYRPSRMPHDTKIVNIMTKRDQLVVADEGISLKEANDLIWEYKVNQLPVVDKEGKLIGMVFRKDYEDHRTYPNELLDASKRICCGAGINTHDYKERIPALLDAKADVLCIDSSDGYSAWQEDTLRWAKEEYGEDIIIGAGNVVDAEAFNFLAKAGADFIKVGIGGGSICITREQKGIGRGQASAVLEVAKARDDYFEKTGIYIPICSDGGIVYDYHMALALAMGADFLMLGRYFARFDESPGKRLTVNGSYVKEYWGEGSNRARNWQRYSDGDELPKGTQGRMHFEEGVDSYVPYAGSLKENVSATLSKLKSTMVSCGAITLPEFHAKARLIAVSPTSIVEGGAHDVIRKESEGAQY